MSPHFEHLRGLSMAEKLQLIGDLWGDIESSKEPFPEAIWFRAEDERRVAEMTADPSNAIDEDEMWRRVDAGRGQKTQTQHSVQPGHPRRESMACAKIALRRGTISASRSRQDR
jgi:putative addiction module component (TIGR02574 family)